MVQGAIGSETSTSTHDRIFGSCWSGADGSRGAIGDSGSVVSPQFPSGCDLLSLGYGRGEAVGSEDGGKVSQNVSQYGGGGSNCVSVDIPSVDWLSPPGLLESSLHRLESGELGYSMDMEWRVGVTSSDGSRATVIMAARPLNTHTV